MDPSLNLATGAFPEITKELLDSLNPTYQSSIMRFQSVDISDKTRFRIPKYKHVIFWHMVAIIRYKQFVNDVDDLHASLGLPLLNRPDMEAAWYQKCYVKYLQYQEVYKPFQGDEEQELKLYVRMFREVMDQRRTPEMESYWKKKKERYPEMDITDASDDNDTIDRIPGLVGQWQKLVDEDLDPKTHVCFEGMPEDFLDMIKQKALELKHEAERAEDDTHSDDGIDIEMEGDCMTTLSYRPKAGVDHDMTGA